MVSSVSTDVLDIELITELFGLGDVTARAERVASGWGDHNAMWRVTTAMGVWAVKQIRRDLPLNVDGAFAIEMAAYEGGVPAPRPIASRHGRCYESVSGSPVRCHEWTDGTAKSNEKVASADARRMGAVVAHLHALQIPVTEGMGAPLSFSKEHWLDLAASARDTGAAWASTTIEHVDQLVRIGQVAERRRSELASNPVVGSHNDLNAHNVLFGDKSLTIVDWDAAGPQSPRFERSTYPMLWAQREGGGYDAERVDAFLRGYLDGGGTIEIDDGESLWLWLGGLIWWAEQNVRLAVDFATPSQDQNANDLLDAILSGPATIEERQEFLRHCTSRLI